jgi:O-antigen/teichoic acid export membrane protein
MKILFNIQEITKDKIKILICRIYFFLFKKTPGQIIKKFLKNLFFAFFGVGGSTLITFGINILIIRHLRPTEFGKWNLIGNVAEFFIILPLWGLTTASLHYLGAERNKYKEIIGTSTRIVLLLSILFFPLYFILTPVLSDFLKIDVLIYNFAVLYAFILVFFYLFQTFFQGLEKFKQLSKLLISSAFIFVVIALFYLFILKNHSFETLLWGNICRLSLIILVGFFVFRKSLFQFSRQFFKKLFHYGSFSMLSVFAGFFSLGMIDNLMINYYLGLEAVGLYSIYYLSFNIFVGRILNTFSQVFLPVVSGCKNIMVPFSQLLILMKKTGVLVLTGMFVLTWLLFQFCGSAFVFDWRLAILMAFSVTLYTFLMILGNIIASVGIRGIRYGVIFSVLSAMINVTFNAFLIPRFELFGAIIATIIATLVIFFVALYVLRFKLTKNE